MKNFTVMCIVSLLLVLVSIPAFAQSDAGNDKIWSIMRPDPNVQGKVEMPPNTWVPGEPVSVFYDLGSGIVVGPNFRPKPGSNTTQSETSVDVHPTNKNIIFCSANATNWPYSVIYGTGVYWSVDGAANWTGYDDPPFGRNSGDPVSVIGPDGRFYENYISNPGGQGVAVSTNNGVTWTTHTVAPNPGSLADKNHYMVDKTASSPFVNRSYCTWTDFGGANNNQAVVRYSTNFGVNWSASINLSSSLTPGSHAQGVNVQTGPNGEVYDAFAIYDNWPTGEDAIGFAKSTNGGVNWTSARVYGALTPNGNFNFGIRGTLSNKNGIRVASFPSMAVDRSGGPRNGWIYMTWPQRGVSPAGSDPDIVLIRSTDGGATWSAPVRVNDDPLNNGKDQYYPWCTVDQTTGQLLLVFYDSRNVPNNQAEVYMARSLDGGLTFENFKVSDAVHTPAPIPGLAGGYAGDYIGIAAHDNVAYPYWAENRTGNYQGWMAVVTFGPPCPINPPSNPNPVNGATGLPLTGNSLSWTNGTGSNQIELWFGPQGSLSMVYSGSPITSYSLAPHEPFSYNTIYGWKVVGKNDTCNVSGPIWTFTTMQDPNLVTKTDTICPQNGNYWTGTCNSSTKTQVSLVHGENQEVGWMVYNTAPIVNDPTTVIQQVVFRSFLYANSWPYWSITPMGTVDPRTATASAIHSQIVNNYQQGTAYGYYQESSTLTNGWITRTLEPHANVHLKNKLASGWFAVGIVDFDFSSSWYVRFQGWNEPNRPCLIVTYQYVIPVELASFAANVNGDMVELSWITATETNNQGFEIQRSSGGNFEAIGYVEGYGTTTEMKAYSFVDKNVNPGCYTYRLKQIDFDGTFEYSSIVEVEVEAPAEFALEQNYPNPFNPTTTIKYSIPKEGHVRLAIYNMLGEEITTLVNNIQKAGKYEVEFNASGLSSGVYVYRIETPDNTSSKKLVLMK